MARDPGHTGEVLRVDVRGERMVPVAADAMAAAARALGVAEADAARVADAVALTCRTVAERCFDDTSGARLEVAMLEGPAGVGVRVSDHGLPFALEAGGGLDALLAELTADRSGRPLVERVEARSTDSGTEVEIGLRSDPTASVHLEEADAVGHEPVGDDVRLTARELRRADCESLARCVWRVYRYTYVADYLYHPDRVWDLVQRGWLRSWVAVDASDEVVAHIGLITESPGTRVADASLALTDPRFRHHHAMEAVGALMSDAVAGSGLVGTFAEAVTAHTITQRGMVRQGAVETGVLMGFIPASMSYRGILEDLDGTRQSAVLGYNTVRPTPPRTVALPERYSDELRRVFAAARLERPEVAPAPGAGPSQLAVELDAPRDLATVVVERAGEDLVDAIDRQRRRACAAGAEVVHAELPLGDPGAAAAVDGLVARGFFYAGVIPELRDGDVLRLQYLDVDVDPASIRLYSDEARRLLDMALADRR